jgi:hypothetical protein
MTVENISKVIPYLVTECNKLSQEQSNTSRSGDELNSSRSQDELLNPSRSVDELNPSRQVYRTAHIING